MKFEPSQSSRFNGSEPSGLENRSEEGAIFDEASTQTSSPLECAEADSSSISVVLPRRADGDSSSRRTRFEADANQDERRGDDGFFAAVAPGSETDDSTRRDWDATTRFENDPTVVSKETTDAAIGDEIDGGGASGNELKNLGALPPGTRFGHFVVAKYIGGGGMGRVYEGVDSALDRKVAIKVLPRRRAQDRATVARFLNEAKSAARLNNEHIAQVYFCGEENGVPFIAFEYVSGTNLRDYVRERGVLELGEAIDYVLQAADALAHASAHGVTHRDVKPSNIIVTPQKSAKLIDMGLARLLKSDVADDLTESGVTLGTFDYISPEQARDPRVADVRSDVYSLGCTFYYMLVGTPPFPDGTVLQKLLQHQGDEAPDVREANPTVPVEVAAVVKKMMKKNPDERYQTPDALIADLLEIAEMIGLRLSDRGADGAATLEKNASATALSRLPGVCAIAIFLCAIGLFYWTTRGSDVRLPVVETAFAPTKSAGFSDASGEKRAASGTTGENDASTTRLETPTAESFPGFLESAVSARKNVGELLSSASLDAVYSVRFGVSDGRRPILLVDDGREWRRDFLSGSASLGEERRIAAGWRSSAPGAVGETASSISISAPENASVSRSMSAYSLLGVSEDASTSGVSGVVRRTVDRLGSAPQAFATLQGALSGVRELNAPLRVELKFNGTLETPPLALVGTKVEIVAAEGFRPTLLFKPPDASNGDWGERMFLLSGGELTLDGVSVDFTVPSQEVVAAKWSVFETLGASTLTIRGGTLTVCNALDDAFGAPLHSNVALFRTPEKTAFEELTAIVRGSGKEKSAPIVRLKNAFVRCESAVFVAERTDGAFWAENSALIASGPILQIGAEDAKAVGPNARFSLNFERSVVVGRVSLARCERSDLENAALPLDVSLVDSFVRLAAAPLAVAYLSRSPKDGAPRVGGDWNLSGTFLFDVSEFGQARLRRSTQFWNVPASTEIAFESKNLADLNVDAPTRLDETPPHSFEIGDFLRWFLTPVATSTTLDDAIRAKAEEMKATLSAGTGAP